MPVGSYLLENSSKWVYYEDLPVPWVLELELTPKFQNPVSNNPLEEANAFLHLIPHYSLQCYGIIYVAMSNISYLPEVGEYVKIENFMPRKK